MRFHFALLLLFVSTNVFADAVLYQRNHGDADTAECPAQFRCKSTKVGVHYCCAKASDFCASNANTEQDLCYEDMFTCNKNEMVCTSSSPFRVWCSTDGKCGPGTKEGGARGTKAKPNKSPVYGRISGFSGHEECPNSLRCDSSTFPKKYCCPEGYPYCQNHGNKDADLCFSNRLACNKADKMCADPSVPPPADVASTKRESMSAAYEAMQKARAPQPVAASPDLLSKLQGTWCLETPRKSILIRGSQATLVEGDATQPDKIFVVAKGDRDFVLDNTAIAPTSKHRATSCSLSDNGETFRCPTVFTRCAP